MPSLDIAWAAEARLVRTGPIGLPYGADVTSGSLDLRSIAARLATVDAIIVPGADGSICVLSTTADEKRGPT